MTNSQPAMTMSAPLPAVENTTPRVIARWTIAYTLTSLGVLIPLLFQIAIALRGGPTQSLFLAALAVQALTIAALLWLLLRYARIRRALRQTPRPCLNCLHPLTDPATCPECGRHQNTQDLSDTWKHRLNLPTDAP